MCEQEKNASYAKAENRTTTIISSVSKMGDLDDEQRALIPHPLRGLTLHCVYKGLEAGPVVAMATALPYQLYKSKKNPSLIPILSRVGTMTVYGALTGVVLSVAMMHVKLRKEEYNEYKIWDRAYRLQYSESQKRADKFSLAASIVGGLLGFLIGLPTKMSPISAGKGALMAVPFGLLAHITIKPLQRPETESTTVKHKSE